MENPKLLSSPIFGNGIGMQTGLSDVKSPPKKSPRELSNISRQRSPRRHNSFALSPGGGKHKNMPRSMTNPEILLTKRLQSSETDLNFLSANRIDAADAQPRSNSALAHISSVSANGAIGIIQAENIIKEKIRRRYTEIRDAFQTLDSQRSFTVNTGDFRRVIHAFCLQLTDEQFSHLLLKIGAKRDSMINYISFLEKFRIGSVLTAEIQRPMNSRPRTAEQRLEPFEEVENRIKLKLTSNLANFLKAVRLFDYNRDGHIQRNELKRVLDNCCFKLQDSYFDKLLHKYDITHSNNSVEYLDFLKRLGIETRSRERSEARKQNLFLDRPSKSREQAKSNFSQNSEPLVGMTLPQLEKKFREKVILKFGDVKRAFVAFDKKRDGFITLDELKRVLVNFVFPMSDHMFSQLMERCGVRATHKMAYDHFLDKFKHPGQEGNGQTIPIKPSHKVNPIREAESPLEMKEIWTMLRNHIINSYSSIKKAFLVFDDDKDGRVRRKEFRKILKTFPFPISDEQFREVMRRVDPDGNGFISYHQFLDTFETREGQGAHPWLSNQRRVNQSNQLQTLDRERAEDILRTKIMDNWKTIAKAFINVDENSDGFISQKELKTLLTHFHLPITEEHFKDLWKKCDLNFDGKIQYCEFMKNLGVDITSGDLSGISTRITDESEEKIQLMKTDQQSRLNAASKNAFSRTTQMDASQVIKVLRDHMAQKSADFRKTFLKYDYDGDKKLSKREFRLTLHNMGLLMSDDQYKELTNRLGFFHGTMSYSEFLERFEDIERFGEGGKTLHLDNHRFNKIIERADSMTAEEVEEIMRKKISESFQSLRQAFYTVDANHDAHITRPEFRRLLDMFMIPINDVEFDRLMTERLDVRKNGTISYKEFISRFQQNENFQKGHPWLFSDQNTNSTKNASYLTAQEANKCLKQKATDQWHDVSSAFRAFDKDGNSIVTKEELKSILHRFNIPVHPKEFGKLWRIYDTDKNGHVDHAEFLWRLGVEFAPGDVDGVSNKITKGSESEMQRHSQSQQMKHERATINQANTTAFMSAMDVEKQLRDKFRDNYGSFRKAFEQVDSNKDGLVSKAELTRVLREHYFFMNEKELTNLLSRIGFANKESLSYEHFLSAFEDPRLSGNSRLTLDSSLSIPGQVNFESAEDLTSEQAIVKLRNKVAQNENSIRSAFGAFDKNGSGCINKDDLHMIINSFCFKISDKQFKDLLKKINVRPDNTVDYESFIESFQKSDAEASKRWLENLLKKDTMRSPKEAQPLSYDVMEDKIAAMIQSRINKISKAFADSDLDNSGRIFQDTLHQILTEHTLRLRPDHFNQLWNKFEQDSQGAINYRDFLKYFAGSNMGTNTRNNADSPLLDETYDEQPLNEQRQPMFQEKPTSPPFNARSANEVEERIKAQVSRSWKNLTRSFKEMDLNENGEILASYFKEILENNGIMLSNEESTILERKYGVESKGRINYKDFLKKNVNDMNNNEMNKQKPAIPVTKQMAHTDNEYLNALTARIQFEIQDNWKVMRRAFKNADRTGSGVCTTIELRQMMRKFRIELSEEEFYHLMSYFDKAMTGKVSYNDFLKAHLAM